MKIEVLGKIYEVLEIIPKKHEEYDLFVCTTPAGYKECFQRIDIGREPKIIKMSDAVSWTTEEIDIIKQEFLKGKTTDEISKNEKLNRHTQTAIRSRAIQVRNRMVFKNELAQNRKREPRFNIKF